MMLFSTPARTWRKVRPLDEVGFCRAFAAWAAYRPPLAHWVGGPGLPYADCLAGLSAQLVVDANDDYRAPAAEGDARALVSDDGWHVIAGRDLLWMASDPAADPAVRDPYPALGELLTWLWHCGRRGRVGTAVLLDGFVQEAGVNLEDRPPDLYPIAFGE